MLVRFCNISMVHADYCIVSVYTLQSFINKHYKYTSISFVNNDTDNTFIANNQRMYLNNNKNANEISQM